MLSNDNDPLEFKTELYFSPLLKHVTLTATLHSNSFTAFPDVNPLSPSPANSPGNLRLTPAVAWLVLANPVPESLLPVQLVCDWS